MSKRVECDLIEYGEVTPFVTGIMTEVIPGKRWEWTWVNHEQRTRTVDLARVYEMFIGSRCFLAQKSMPADMQAVHYCGSIVVAYWREGGESAGNPLDAKTALVLDFDPDELLKHMPVLA